MAANTTATTSGQGASGQQISSSAARQHQPSAAAAAAAVAAATAAAKSHSAGATTSGAAANHLSMIGGSSAAFQQIKQTQASLARLTRVHQLQHQQQQLSQINQSSHQAKEATASQHQAAASKSTTFVDCLIRRFKDCFSEDFCTVPMFVVGNLSPGSDGTHLILPPCVSLGRQSISRFANPRNTLRHMNSIRESCKSIEDLDLGGNKLSDLIEVYKILQCTPNLKFLNLSENDLSKTSPVAMACCPQPSSSSTYAISASPSYTSSSNQQQQQQQQPNATHWQPTNAAGSVQQPHQRACLAPINQNQPPTTMKRTSIGARRHSTLGQSSNGPPGSGRPTLGSRATEARRLAATAALAQSKKTSSSVASKLASSAATSATVSSRQSTRAGASSRPLPAETASGLERGKLETSSSGSSGREGGPAARLGNRQRVATASTMNLARSMSSLSAKDVQRVSGRNLLSNRLPAHREAQVPHRSSMVTSNSSGQLERSTRASMMGANQAPTRGQLLDKPSKPGSGAEMFGSIDVPIVETDADVDMNESATFSQQAPATVASGRDGPASSNSTTTEAGPAQVHHQSSTSRALMTASQTGISNVSKTSAISTAAIHSQQTSTTSNFRRTFKSIKALALNNTGCPWRVVCSILSRMPNLAELHLSLNNYERIDLEPSGFKHHSLKRLYLCNNPKLTSWQELDKLLNAFPSLEALSIADCNISQIPDNLDRASEWQKLCGLNINGWPIKEWPVVERLNQLPSLIDLKCRNLEVLNSIDEPRHHLIARLPKLQRLNGSEIEEREHAEKAFLRFFMANSHLERPSRFHELVRIHGEVATSVDVDVDLSPPTQASVRVIYLNRNYYRKENQDDILMSEDFLTKLMDNVEPYHHGGPQQQQQQHNSLENMDDCDSSEAQLQAAGSVPSSKPIRLFKDESQEVIAIDVDLRQSVRKFKSTLATLLGLDSQNIILYYIDHEMVGLMGPELIKHNQKKLWNYNVQDGDQFIVEDR